MKSLFKSAVLLSVHHLAKQTVIKIEQQMNKDDKSNEEQKHKILLATTIHALLSIVYND